jgi:hypothetical protein
MLTIAQNESFRTTHTGFWVASAGARQLFRDEDVFGMKVATRREADLLGDINVIQSLQLRVRETDQERWVLLSHEVGPFDEDRLATLRERLLEDLLERACRALERGDEVHGEGWTLSLLGFTDHQSGQTCFPQQISAATWEADELCLWHEDEAQPFARYPRDAENAFVLYHLLGQFLPNTESMRATSVGVGLGKRLADFTTFHRHGLAVRRVPLLISLIAAAMLCCMSLYSLSAGIVFLTMVMVVALPVLRSATHRLRHYEQGVIWSCGSDENVLLFDQIGAFSADWRLRGGDTGLGGTVQMEFQPLDRLRPSIQMTIQVDETTKPAAEALQAQVCAIVAERMRMQLQENGRVRWTSRLSILPNGLEELEGRAGPIHVFTFAEIAHWRVAAQRLTLWLNDDQTIVSLPTSEVNFYPGLMLLQMQNMLT